MAYLADFATTYLNGAVTAGAMNMPTHQANDILIMFITMDTGTATITSGTGWSTIASNTTQASITASWSWKRAASSTEAVSITTTDAYCCGIYCIRDVDTTTAIDVSALSSAAAPTLPAKPISDAVTTTTANCFVLYLLGSDLVATAAHSDPGVHHITSFDNAGTTATTAACQHAAWYIQRTAGAVPTPSWTQSAAAAYVKLTVALRNVTNGIIPAYIDDVSAPATVITPAHNYTATVNNVTWTTTLTSTAAINGKTVTGLAGAAQADLGIVPFSSAVGPATPTNPIARTALQGYQCSLTGNRNFSTGLIMGSFIGSTPKMGTFGIGSVAEGGCVVRMGSSATAWCAWQVAAKDAVPTTEVRSVWAIQPSYTGSAYGTPGTAITTSAVSHIQFLYNCPSFASQVVLSEVYQVFPQIIAGGTSTNPVDSDGLAQVGKSFRLPVIQKFGGAGILSYAPIQIGGGDAVNFQIDAGALQFPRRYSATTKEVAYHAADNAVGISYAGKSGDVIKHTSSVVTSPTPYYWEINSAATSAATWDFRGLVVVGATVTLRNVMTFTDMSFVSFTSLNATGCALSGCAFSKPPSTATSITTNATTTFSSCTFDTTTIAAGNDLMTVADVSSIFTNCTFNGSATSGHAIKCTAAGGTSIAINGLNFNNYGATGTTSAAVYFTATTGTITVNVNSGGSGLSYRTAGATINIVNSKVLTISNVLTNSEVRIYKTSDLSELGGVETVSGTPSGLNNVTVSSDPDNAGRYIVSYSYSYSVDTPITIVVLNNQYQALRTTGTLKSTSQSIPVNQIFDRQYLNP